MTFKRIVFHETGRPDAVAELEEAKSGSLGEAEIRVRMQYAPINPADINYLQGTYGKQAPLPATPGMEGAGIVLETGNAVDELEEGNQVILHNHIGSWSQEVQISADQAIKISPGIDPQQAAMLRVNPPTAWRLLTGFRTLQPGEWIAQNAANSGVGLAVIQLARTLGVRTLNVVRREAAMEACHRFGAEHVLVDDRGLKNKAIPILDGSEPSLAFNAVGGDSALRLMDLLAVEGTHVTYGAMAREAVKVPNQFLIFKQIQLRGLWLTPWMRDLASAERRALFDRLAGYVADGTLRLPVERVFPLDQITEALMHAQTDRRTGKVMIDLR